MKSISGSSIAIYEYKLLARLLRNKRPVDEILQLMETPANTKKLDRIRFALEQGAGAQEIFQKLPGSIPQYVCSYLSFLPVDKALESAIRYDEMKTSMRKEIRDSLLYPVSLLLLAIGVLIFFARFLIPQLNGLMDNSAAINHTMALIVLAARCAEILLIGSTVTGIVAVFALKHKKISFLWHLAHLFRLEGPWKTMNALYLSRFLLELHETGLSTRQSLEILEKNPFSISLTTIAHRVSSRMRSGEDFVEAFDDPWLDNKFIQMNRLGYESDSYDETLQMYCAFVWEQFKAQMKRFAIGVQITAYTGIGLIMIAVYSGMLAPLSDIQM